MIQAEDIRHQKENSQNFSGRGSVQISFRQLTLTHDNYVVTSHLVFLILAKHLPFKYCSNAGQITEARDESSACAPKSTFWRS